MKDMPNKQRSDPLWKDVLALAEHIYSAANEIIDNFPDEKWNTANKLRNAANDSLFYVAQATGNTAMEGAEYDWNSARKNLFALQTMYIFAGKQKFLDLDPDIIIKIDKLLAKVDESIAVSKKAADLKDKKALKPWLEKYRLWQEMQDGK